MQNTSEPDTAAQQSPSTGSGDAVERIDRGAIRVLVIDNPPVNALSARVRAALQAELRAALADTAVVGVVIAAAGRIFVAGADITEFGRPPRPPALPDLLDEIEAATKPVVAAIGGAALGGGLELALACHVRLAGPRAQLGLPEVRLGLLPGAGGTQRLPRLIDPVIAFGMIASGKPVDAARAGALGLAELAEGDLVAACVARAEALASEGAPLPRAGGRQADPARRDAFEAAAAKAVAADRDAFNLPPIAACVRAAFGDDLAAGLAVERAAFLELMGDPRSAALRHLFFAEREAAKVPGVGRDVAARSIGRVAVIGAGTMGGGIAMAMVQAGLPVTLIETDTAALERGTARIHDLWAGSIRRGSLSEDEAQARRARLTGSVDLADAAGADLVIEAVFEEMSVKTDLFGRLDAIMPHGAIVATNTSYLDIDRIASAISHPERVLGLHFFSPANVMRLLEIVRGAATAPETIATALALARRIGKLPVVVGNCPGFVGNRILGPRGVAAERLLLSGIPREAIDAAVVDFGFRMGPLAMGDLAGLDIGYRNRRAYGGFAPIADRLVEGGRLGQKTGAGYFAYPDGARQGVADDDGAAVIAATAAEQGMTARALDASGILARLFYPMINEAARILDEGIASGASDIDLVWVNGYGWPAWRGGPMHWADREGLTKIAEQLELFADETGDERLRPADLLSRLAAEGGRFADLPRRT